MSTSLVCLPLSGSRRFNRSIISGVRGICSLPLIPLELEAAEEDPPLIMHEVRSSPTLSTIPMPCCLRGAYMFYCFVGYMLSYNVPPQALSGTVGGLVFRSAGVWGMRGASPLYLLLRALLLLVLCMLLGHVLHCRCVLGLLVM
jgi:hypothetical protein